MRIYKCYGCKKEIEGMPILVEKNGKNIRFHDKCHKDYLLKQKEKEEFELFYDYIRLHLMEYDKITPLNKNMIRRLQSSRAGKIVGKGMKMPKGNVGNTYKDLYNTCVVLKDYIKIQIKNKSFDSDVQKLFYIMSIVDSKVIDVKKAIERKKKSQKIAKDKLNNIEIKQNSNKAEYKSEDKEVDKEDEELW